MSEVRVGLGIDLHPLAREGDDRPLVLGGVRFEGERGLVGHSDADAIAHALCDAMFGAAGMGDIGEHYPDTDARFAGADSLDLLRETAARLAGEGWHLLNADCSLVAERPRVADVRAEMMKKLSEGAGGPVHVKATRPERLGALGRLEGVACLAVALIER
ncbi:MAG: 2-C-methyl-D-erythritol 2,4-cyclodiphosphate synthase [Acidimicrobiales bacterium]